MHKKTILHIIGYILVFLGLSMSFSALVSLYYGENDLMPIVKSMAFTIFFGLLIIAVTKKPGKDISVRDGFAVVTIGWIIMAAYSALPFWLSGEIPTYTDSYFEAMSGLTTTGASVLGHPDINEIENLSHGILFWRSFTHFIGGMGIIVFSIAMLPMLGMGGVQLFRAEVAGPVADKLTPRVKQTAKYLWSIYVGFVALETIILMFEGMSWFDAICHSFGTMATGGFSTKNESISAYNSPVIEFTIILFMFLAATNFSLHYQSITNKKFFYFKDSEFKFYFSAIIISCAALALDISIKKYGWTFDSIRHSLFTTVSLITTTGFVSENYESWPGFSKTVIFFFLFLGGSAGSTTGALKLIRTILVIKYLIVEMRKLLHPKGVFLLTIGNNVIKDNVVKNTLGFYLFYLAIFVICAIILSTMGIDTITSLTASASAIGNIGPGLGSIGPAENWGHFPAAAKWIISFCMLLGRLEIFTVLVLFSKGFWKE